MAWITARERASSGLSIVNNLIGPFKSQIPNSKRVILFPVGLLSVAFLPKIKCDDQTGLNIVQLVEYLD